jgi:prepilin-type N-terminal cleavage/methylation domain-containing protein
MKKSVWHGFTLIELSLVLVIIGLLIGSILFGKDLIQAAQARAAVRDFESYKTTFQTFKNKYNCIPGDCKNATDFFGTQGGGLANGDGNDQIGWSTEASYAFWEMDLAGFLSVKSNGGWPNAYSKNALNTSGLMYIMYGDLYTSATATRGARGLGHAVTLAKFCSPNVNCAMVTPLMSRLVDTKIDNGLPTSGKFMGFDGQDSANMGSYLPCDAASGSSYIYNDSVLAESCRLVYVVE